MNSEKGVGKKNFSRGGIIQTEGFEGAQRLCRASSVVEQRTENPCVPSSILGPGTTRGYRIAAIILPCQGRDTGSTPVTRSSKQEIPSRGFFVFVKIYSQETGCKLHNKKYKNGLKSGIPPHQFFGQVIK